MRYHKNLGPMVGRRAYGIRWTNRRTKCVRWTKRKRELEKRIKKKEHEPAG